MECAACNSAPPWTYPSYNPIFSAVTMTEQLLSSLPNENLMKLGEFLTPYDMKYLSQTCTSLQDTFRPLSWRVCTVDDRNEEPEINEQISAYTFETCFRRVSSKMIARPNKYSWFHNNKVRLINRVSTVGTSSILDIYKLAPKIDIFKLFPALKKVTALAFYIGDVNSMLLEDSSSSFDLKSYKPGMKYNPANSNTRFQDMLDLDVLFYPVCNTTLPTPGSSWNRVHIKKITYFKLLWDEPMSPSELWEYAVAFNDLEEVIFGASQSPNVMRNNDWSTCLFKNMSVWPKLRKLSIELFHIFAGDGGDLDDDGYDEDEVIFMAEPILLLLTDLPRTLEVCKVEVECFSQVDYRCAEIMDMVYEPVSLGITYLKTNYISNMESFQKFVKLPKLVTWEWTSAGNDEEMSGPDAPQSLSWIMHPYAFNLTQLCLEAPALCNWEAASGLAAFTNLERIQLYNPPRSIFEEYQYDTKKNIARTTYIDDYLRFLYFSLANKDQKLLPPHTENDKYKGLLWTDHRLEQVHKVVRSIFYDVKKNQNISKMIRYDGRVVEVLKAIHIIETLFFVIRGLPRLEYLLVCYPCSFMFSPGLIEMFNHPTIKQVKLVATGLEEWHPAWVERAPEYPYATHYHSGVDGYEVSVLYDIAKKRTPNKYFPFRATLRQLIDDMFNPDFDGWEFE